MINTFNTIITSLTLISHIALIIILAYFAFHTNKYLKKHNNKILTHFKNNGLKYAFTVSLTATLGSLFYSEIAGFTPCLLCWYQRIFMYVLPIITLIAILYKEYQIRKYVITLATIGSFISLYHIFVQITPRFTCASGGVDCGIISTLGFGYITIPVMALTAFAMIIILTVIQKRK
jgi:disulfide bond formation protein DsbB